MQVIPSYVASVSLHQIIVATTIDKYTQGKAAAIVGMMKC